MLVSFATYDPSFLTVVNVALLATAIGLAARPVRLAQENMREHPAQRAPAQYARVDNQKGDDAMTATTTRPEIDFDHRSENYRDNWVDMAADLHATGNPIAWTEAHGGFWVVASWDGVHQVGGEWETFTSVNDLDGTQNGGKGQAIPQQQYAMLLGESDPPLHTERRRLEVPFFTPKALRRWRPIVQQFLAEAIDNVIESGSAELIDDVIIPTTARTTLFVVGYDADDWEDAAAAAHKGSIIKPHEPGFPLEETLRIRDHFRELLAERKKRPTGDIVSALAHGTIQGRPTTDEEGESMMNALVFGGFDTTTAAVANSLIWLDKHPDLAERVRTDEPFRKQAIEELLRVSSPAGMARTAVRDTELMGQQIRAGEVVFMWNAAANRDPRKFPQPNTVDLERDNASENVTFSTGPHRCLGSPLAKIEISEILSTLPSRLENLRIDHDSLVRYPRLGGVQGYIHVPATFTAGEPAGRVVKEHQTTGSK